MDEQPFEMQRDANKKMNGWNDDANEEQISRVAAVIELNYHKHGARYTGILSIVDETVHIGSSSYAEMLRRPGHQEEGHQEDFRASDGVSEEILGEADAYGLEAAYMQVGLRPEWGSARCKG